MKKISNQKTMLTLQITEEEKAIAKQSKIEFKLVLKELKDAIKIVLELRDSILEQRPSKENLNTQYRGRLLRYNRKIINAFNIFLKHLKVSLNLLGKINDPDINRLREILVSEISELTDGIEYVSNLLKEPIKEDFTKNIQAISAQLEKREHSINDAIGNQLFNHIDHDLLGMMRISQIKFNIKKRSRLIIQLVK